MVAKFRTLDGLVPAGGPSKPWYIRDPGVPLPTYSPPPRDPERLWRSQPSLRKVVSFAARNVAQLSWHAYQRVSDDDRQRLADSAAVQMLGPVDSMVSAYMLIEQLQTDAMVYDRYCAILDDSQLVRLPPKLWRVKSDWLGRPTKVVLLAPGGVEVDITDAPLVIGWGWGDTSAGGISPMDTLGEIMDEANTSVRWRRQQWDGAPKFNGILKHPSTFKSDRARETFQLSWSKWRDERRGTPILEDGMDYINAPTVDVRAIRDIEGRQLTDVEVASAFHIPPELVGARPGNFSNMQAFRSMLYGTTLGPAIIQLQQSLNRVVKHVDVRPGVYLEANREGAINGSLLEQAQVLQTMTGGPIMTRAEARARMNLPHLEGTDELIVPLNVLTGGLASPTDTGRNSGAKGLPGDDGEDTPPVFVDDEGES